MKQRLLWVSFLFFGATSFASTKIFVDCRGIDEVIVATHKKTGAIGKAYICSQMLKKRPIAIITDKDGDGKLTPHDTIAYYLSKDFTLFKKSLSKANDHFEEDLENYYTASKQSSTYYEIKIKSLVNLPDGEGISVDTINEICVKSKLLDGEEVLNEADKSYSNTSVEDLYRKSFYDPETDLYLMRERYYDPEIGRFLSPDPIGFASGDPNPYRYAKNNPTNYVDPTGLDAARIDVITSGKKYPHSILIVDNPNGGVTAIDYGPTERHLYTGTVPGAVGVKNYPSDTIDSLAQKYGALISPRVFKTTPAQDREIINRAEQFQRRTIPYNPLGLFGGKNCFGISSSICGNVCQ